MRGAIWDTGSCAPRHKSTRVGVSMPGGGGFGSSRRVRTQWEKRMGSSRGRCPCATPPAASERGGRVSEAGRQLVVNGSRGEEEGGVSASEREGRRGRAAFWSKVNVEMCHGKVRKRRFVCIRANAYFSTAVFLPSLCPTFCVSFSPIPCTWQPAEKKEGHTTPASATENFVPLVHHLLLAQPLHCSASIPAAVLQRSLCPTFCCAAMEAAAYFLLLSVCACAHLAALVAACLCHSGPICGIFLANVL